jgi:hypothetical protein
MAEVGEPVVLATSAETGEFSVNCYGLDDFELCCYWQNERDND